MLNVPKTFMPQPWFILGGLALGLALPLQAQRPKDFAVPPQLLRAATSNYSSTYDYASYTFEVAVAATGEANLGRLQIALPEGVGRIEVPEPSEVKVLNRERQPIPAQVTTIEGRTVQIEFLQPPTPGQTVVIVFEGMRNPRIGGAYLFGITAFAVDQPKRPWFLSYARIHFYEPGR